MASIPTPPQRRPARDVQTRLNYIREHRPHDPNALHPGLYQDFGLNKSNLAFELGPEETIRDANGRDVEFDFDTHGFKWLQSPTTMSLNDFSDADKVKEVYHAEVEKLIKDLTGADFVYIFNSRARGARKNHPIKPATNVHVDTQPQAVADRIQTLYGDERFEQLMQGRVQVFNVWRSINDVPIADWPLICCSGTTLKEESCHIAIQYPADPNQLYTSSLYAHYQPDLEWWYWGDQNRDSVAVFKQADNAEVPTQHVLHGSMLLPNVPEGTEPRESWECRVLTLHFPEQHREELEEAMRIGRKKV